MRHGDSVMTRRAASLFIHFGGCMNRRDFLKTLGVTTAGFLLSNRLPMPAHASDTAARAPHGTPKVYFTRAIDPESLKKLYRMVNSGIGGKTAIKVHTGETNAPYIIPSATVRELMTVIPNSAIVETNVFYDSPRHTTEGHREVLKSNGWTFSPVDIMDEDGYITLPVPGGKWFKEIPMGKNIVNYDSMLVLTHFKGHAIGGFGGSLKNIGIGCASGQVGKKMLHQKDDDKWGFQGERFMEHMVESGKAVINHFGGKMAFINVLFNLSVDCDCSGTHAAPPTIPDIGILASTDILAVDQASVDMVYALPEETRRPLVERIESRKGLRQLEYMSEMNMGSKQYELVDMD